MTGLLQVATILVLLGLAAYLDVENYGLLNIQLAASALVSILLGLQFHRVYVRIRQQILPAYIAFHLQISAVMLLVLLSVAFFVPQGVVSLILAGAMALSQIALYSLARQGRFRLIWSMKATQAASLLGATLYIYALGADSMFWVAFGISYASAGLFALQRPVVTELGSFSLKRTLRRFRYSIRISLVSLGSMSTSAFIREFPVLLAGAMGRTDIAGALGLLMRIVGSPIAFLARSASAVVSNYVASARFGPRELVKLTVVPLLATCYIAALVALFYFDLGVDLRKFEVFGTFLIVAAPYFIVRSYIGLLGSAFIYFGIQHLELIKNTSAAAISILVGLLVYFGIWSFQALLVAMSLAATLFGGSMVVKLRNSIRA